MRNLAGMHATGEGCDKSESAAKYMLKVTFLLALKHLLLKHSLAFKQYEVALKQCVWA